MSFAEILHQPAAVEILTGQLRSGRIPHACLFLGTEGVGRRKAALELARALNCAEGGETRDACGECVPCRKIAQGLHPDVRTIDLAYQAELEEEDLEKQKTLKIGTIRALQHEVGLKPSEGKWKVFIVEPAEKITLDAANCLLKTLEEPPSWTVIILLARHRENLPATIVSRTQIVYFRPLPEPVVAEFLEAKCSVPPDRAAEAAAVSEGSLALALSRLGEKGVDAATLLRDLSKGSLAAADALAAAAKHARNAQEILSELQIHLKREFRRDPRSAGSLVEEVIRSQNLIGRNVNPQMVLDALLLKMLAFYRG